MTTPLPPPGRIVAVLRSRVRTHDWPFPESRRGPEWRTGYVKELVVGPVHLGPEGLDGDEQGDRRVHGGPDRAVLAYAESHYAEWRRELKIPEMGPGGFGENLVVTGFDEHTVSLGDVFEIGEARVQVSQPRGPCSNISRRWRRPDMVQRVTETLRFGWYMRTLAEGDVETGMSFRLVERPTPEWTVARVFQARRNPEGERGDLARLAANPALTPGWREVLAEKARELGGVAGGGA